MPRILIAVALLIAVLAGLKFYNAPELRRFFNSTLGTAPPTQTTGFNTPVPSNISETTQLSPPTSTQNNAPPPDNGGNGSSSDGSTTSNNSNTDNGGNTGSLNPIPGGW